MAVKYFVKNYYHQGKSRWSGQGAEKLGLSGAIDNEQEFSNVIEGRSLDGSEQLNARVLKPKERRAALDCTFSAPKSVSLMALVGGDLRLIAAHHQALKEVIALMETRYACTRVTDGNGRHRENTGNLVVAQFDHIESRDLDPHLHTHCLVMNMTQTSDGKWMSLVNGEIFANKKFLGMTYQSFLAREIQKLGYEVEQRQHGQFEIKGFKQQDLEAFSKRRQQILATAGANSTWAERNQVWDNTRKRKEKVTEDELKSLWQQEAADLGISFVQQKQPQPEVVNDLANQKDVNEILDSAIAHCSERTVAFKFEEIAKFVLGERLATDITQIEPLLKKHPGILALPGLEGYTTLKAVERELATIELMERGKQKVNPISHPEVFKSKLEKTLLNQGQRQAVAMALTTKDSFVAWQGVAGAGKTFALKELKALASDAGYTVKGFAPSSMAAKVLSEELEIQSETVARLLVSEPPPEPEANQIWIVDEAGLLSAKDAHALLEKATAQGARLLLVGDTKQLSSVEAGNPFKSLQQARIKTAHLTQSNRQRNPDLKIAVDLIANGRIEAGFQQLEAIGSITEVQTEAKLETIAREYMALTPAQRGRTLVLAGTNAEKLALTQAIRDKLKVEGSLGKSANITQLQAKNLTKVQMQYTHNYEVGDFVMPTRNYKRRGLEKGQLYEVVSKDTDKLTLKAADGTLQEVDTLFDKAVYQCNEIEIAVGDRLQWKKNDRLQERRNGQEFVVTAVDDNTIKIQYLESSRTETINLKQAQNLDYALVSTTYSSQGKTAEQTLISADYTIGQESFYVAVSRAKDRVKLFTEDKQFLLELAQKSKAKENALEMLRNQVKQQSAASKTQISIIIEEPVAVSTVASPVLKTDLTVVIETPKQKQQSLPVAVTTSRPIPKQPTPEGATVEKPKLKQRIPTEAFWVPTSAPAPNYLDPEHWQELVNKSVIHPDIAAKNFSSLQFSYIGAEHEAWERLMVSEKLNRTNIGRLTQGLISAYAHLDAGGWWCDAGVDPRTFADLTPGDKPVSKRWGCYKPNMPRPKKDESGQVIEGKFIKYEHPPKVDLSIFLLDVPKDIAERIYTKSGVNPSDSDRKSGFWYCVWKYNIPITITEGAKKAASLLSQGYAAIGLPGISAGYRNPKDDFGNKIGKLYLHEELAVFATPKREISFCFDYETKPKTLRNVEIATSQTGRLLERQGAKVRVVNLPGPDKGVDDFIMAQGPLAYEKVSHSAMTLRDWQRHNQKQRAAIIEPPRKLAQQESSSQQNQTKEQTDDRQQPNSDTVINRKDRAIVNQPRETECENRAFRNESSRELEQHQSQSLELLTAINRYVELQKIEQLGADIARINQSLADGWLQDQRTTNLSADTPGQNSTTIDRTESHGHPQQPASEQLLNAITDFLETAAIESTNIVKDLQALTENLGHYQNKDSVRAIVLDAAAGIADFIDQSAVETALVKALPQVTEQLSQYQQQLVNGKTLVKQLEQLLLNKPLQNQALAAIAEYLELQAVEASTVEIVSKLVEQLKQLPQHSPQDTQQTTDNLLKAISEYVEENTITTSPTVSVLEEMKIQLEQSQSHGTTGLQTLIEKLGYHQSQQLELSMKEILLGLNKQELISLISKVSDYFEQPHQENDPHLSEMQVIRQLIRDEKPKIVEKLNSLSELELEAEILELSEEIMLLEEIELLEAELESECRSQSRGFRI